MGNADLKWEATQEIDLGFDFVGFNGRVTASFDWYTKKTSDILLQVPDRSIFGYRTSAVCKWW